MKINFTTFLFCFLLPFLGAEPKTEETKTEETKILFYEDIEEKIRSAFENEDWEGSESWMESHFSYARKHLFALMQQFLDLKISTSPSQTNPTDIKTLQKQIATLRKKIESSSQNHYLHDVWVQVKSWSLEEQKQTRLTDALFSSYHDNKTVSEQKKILQECLGHYQKLNDQPGIFKAQEALFRLRIHHSNDDDLLSDLDSFMESIKETEQDPDLAKSIELRSLLHLRENNVEKALEEIEKAQRQFQKTGDLLQVARLDLRKGEIHSKSGYYDQAFDHFKKALKTFRQSPYEEERASFSISLGNLYLRQNRHKEALTHYSEANEIFEKMQYAEGQAKVLNNMGVVSSRLEDKTKAQNYLNQSMEMAKKSGNLHQLAETGNNLGSEYLKAQNIPKAIATYKEALKASRACKAHEIEIKALHNLGMAQFYSGEKQIAIQTLNESLSMSRRSGQVFDAMETSFLLGKILTQENNPSKAKTYLEISLNQAQKINHQARIKEIEKLMQTP